MLSLRDFLRSHRMATLFVLLAALTMRALVPAGFMLSAGHSALQVTICGDAAAMATAQLLLPHQTSPDPAGHDHSQTSATCAFAALAMVAMGGGEAAKVLALLVLLAIATTARPGSLRLARRRYQRPPLRGPPATV